MNQSDESIQAALYEAEAMRDAVIYLKDAIRAFDSAAWYLAEAEQTRWCATLGTMASQCRCIIDAIHEKVGAA